MKTEDILARVRYDLPETGKIVVGLSGGADSVLLTYLLVRKYGAERLLAVHVHHGIRGAEADRDAEFVQDYCKALELHCKVIYKDIPALAAVSGEGVEECARRVRYACFAEEAGENGCIATAHNADDNAETLLLNLTRGMGPHGAGGIPPRRGRIYRPILNISRAEVEHLCKVYRLDYVTDSTNLTVDYTRNKLRHSVLPVLKDVNPQMTQATSRFAESMRLQNEFVFSCANELLCKAKMPYGYDLEILLRAALELLLSSYGRLSYEHICRAAGCVFMGGSLSLPGDIVLEAKQDTLTVRKNRERKDQNVFSVPLRAGENVLPNGKTLFVEKKTPEKEEIDRKVHNLLFQNFSNCDKITNVPRVRTRRAGDVFRPAGRGVTKSVKKILNELRIPAAISNGLLSITDNKYILLLIINVMLLLLGCFMDMAPLITIMTPILLPVVTNPAIGMDPVHFGVVMIFNLAVGLCTPPVGSALFVGCAIGKTPIERTSKNMLPLYAVMVTVLLLVTYIPEISLWLPRLTGYAG